MPVKIFSEDDCKDIEQAFSNPVEAVVSGEFNKEKALDEFVVWLNESGVSFKHTSKFNDKCPQLAKLLGL